MRIPYDDVVVLRRPEKEGDPSVITVSCPDKIGLGCDLSRILLFFGLKISRVDMSTDGKWCFIVLWVLADEDTRWNLVMKRLIEACPCCSSASGISYYSQELLPTTPPDVFLLKICCDDRRGLLHDVTKVLSELELNIKRVKASTTPDGRVMDLFFITDTRELLHTKKRQEDTNEQLTNSIGDELLCCEIEKIVPEAISCSQSPPFLPPQTPITDRESWFEEVQDSNRHVSMNPPSITIDNSLSPSQTLVQISCEDHAGLLYDILRTFKDYNIQISYGRGSMKPNNECQIDLFIMQSDGKKIVDPNKQSSLCSRLHKELSQPLKVSVISRGPDAELLVANPVELSGKGRPLVFYNITLALNSLNICIFSAEVARHVIDHREWEVYRVLLHEGDCSSVSRGRIEEQVWKRLMGWDS